MKKFTITNGNASATKQSITDQVKTFDDACNLLDLKSTLVTLEIHDDLAGEAKAAIAGLKLMVIVKALNEGWKPDWTNDDEYKYYPWFNLQNGFSLSGVSCSYTSSRVSSRLCFKTRELAEYAANQFLDIYKDYFTNN